MQLESNILFISDQVTGKKWIDLNGTSYCLNIRKLIFKVNFKYDLTTHQNTTGNSY